MNGAGERNEEAARRRRRSVGRSLAARGLGAQAPPPSAESVAAVFNPTVQFHSSSRGNKKVAIY